MLYAKNRYESIVSSGRRLYTTSDAETVNEVNEKVMTLKNSLLDKMCGTLYGDQDSYTVSVDQFELAVKKYMIYTDDQCATASNSVEAASANFDMKLLISDFKADYPSGAKSICI
jgi:hypothetical protein